MTVPTSQPQCPSSGTVEVLLGWGAKQGSLGTCDQGQAVSGWGAGLGVLGDSMATCQGLLPSCHTTITRLQGAESQDQRR